MFSKRLKKYLKWFKRRKPIKHHPKISLLIPFSSKDPMRRATFNWLLEYWRSELPEAEIVIGRSKSKIFCKGEALNDAVKRSHGKVLAILDADAYISGKVIEDCANEILENMHNHLWFVPYRHLFRLNKYVTEAILLTYPQNPLIIPCPPPLPFLYDHQDKSKYGHRYGAMLMIFPREAYEAIGCFDERFKGWGGEDVALLRALDTLYGKHKTKKGCIFHLWHPIIGENYKTRKWEGQPYASPNDKLAMEYHKATRNPSRMRKIVEDAQKFKKKKIWVVSQFENFGSFNYFTYIC